VAANTAPIFGLTPNIGATQFGSAALTKSDGSSGVVGIGTDIFKAFTAGANGSFVEKIRLSPVATAAATATSGTVHRVYVSSKTSGVTANTDTFLIAEVGASAQTADQTVTATFFLEIPLNIKLNANWTILVSTHIVNAANTNWTAVVFGMDF
jgi:hypothetical protein